jgi:S-adenosylmethionine-diacylglycerol 3-amino-3-carboxypropyl transferase
MGLGDWLGGRCFEAVHRYQLVYNACWEDPRIDRQALDLSADDVLLVITSAGCNVLDYLLREPLHIHAVDMNPRQNALFELRRAAIRALDYATFFEMFGRGRLPRHGEVYRDVLRDHLPDFARRYWDRWIGFFSGRGPYRRSFYFHGTTGGLARAINVYIDWIVRVRKPVQEILDAPNVDAQREVFERHRRVFWNGFSRWFIGRDATLSCFGVPPSQRAQVERYYQGGIAGFVEDCVEAVFSQLPFAENYFWRLYLTGEYTPDCCPEYLKKENFERLKAGLIDRVTTHNQTVLAFLEEHPVSLSRFVLLDHMDWMWNTRRTTLVREWEAMIRRAAPNARFIWRSGGLKTDYVDNLDVQLNGHKERLGDRLRFLTDLAADLHARDRVHTYGSFHIAELASG